MGARPRVNSFSTICTFLFAVCPYTAILWVWKGNQPGPNSPGKNMTTKIATWLDIMPAIPLDLGVPVVNSRTGSRGVWIAHLPDLGTSVERDYVHDGGAFTFPRRWNTHEVRVDLDDPQGFGYSMRHWYAAAAATADDAVLRWFELTLWAWTQGILDDSDSLALAHALADVVS